MPETMVPVSDLIGMTVAAGLAGRLATESTIPDELKPSIAQALGMLSRTISDTIRCGEFDISDPDKGLLILATDAESHSMCLNLPKFTLDSDAFWEEVPQIAEHHMWAMIHAFLKEGNIPSAVTTAVLRFGRQAMVEWSAELSKQDENVPVAIVLTVMKQNSKPTAEGEPTAAVGGFVTLAQLSRPMLESVIAERQSGGDGDTIREEGITLH